MMTTQKMSLFVTGTNTDSGKTVISCGLLEKFKNQNLSTVALKPIASGCIKTDQGLRNPDALALHQSMTCQLPYSAINPIAFMPAIAPHIAAQEQSVILSVNHIMQNCQIALNTPADILLVEGAGGWRLPLSNTDNLFLSDFPKQLNMSVILVVGLTLGCLNHAQLTVEAILADQLPILGWVANQVDADMIYVQENIEWLKQNMPGYYLGYVPYIKEGLLSKRVADYLDVEAALNHLKQNTTHEASKFNLKDGISND